MEALPLPPTLASLIHLHDLEHATRVAQLAQRAALRLDLNPTEAYTAGLLHDLGKLVLSDTLLHAPRALTPQEYALVQHHPRHGAQITSRLWKDCPLTVLHAITHHHERENGQGYPDRLTHLAPLTALIAVCDMWDALTQDRPYRARLDVTVATHILMREALPHLTIQAVLSTLDSSA